MHDVEDTTSVPSFADCNTPTRAASNQPAINTCARADELHSKDFSFDKIPIDIIYDPDFYSNLETPDMEAKEKMLNHR
nr:expressed protein [Hymenolepis microstoma]